MGKKGFFGRLAERYLNQQGLAILYCGYRPSLDPVPDFTFKKRRTVTTPQDIAIRSLTEAELNSYIASWTMWFAGWPVPLDAIPPAKVATDDECLGSMGIITSSIVGVAVHHAGEGGKTYILRVPTQLIIPVPQWSLSGVEFASVILHQVPPQAVVGEIPAGKASALAVLPPFGHLGLSGRMANNSPPDNPARFYRDATRQVCLRYQSLVGSGSQNDAHFLSYLEQRYQEEKDHLARLKQEGLPKPQEPIARLGLLILAVGLFTYGRLEVVEDILDSIPPSELRVGRLAWCLNGMLPLPASIGDVLQDSDSVKVWVSSHRDSLHWDDQKGVFVLA